ncbi:fimbrial usher protein (plasmid) [Serratia marcescens]|nr:fimbrial usher protein [Serratia marcescens]
MVNASDDKDEYTFDPALLREALPSQFSVDYAATEPYFQPGNYDVDLYLNGKFQSSTSLKLTKSKGNISICLPGKFYKAFAIRAYYLSSIPMNECSNPTYILPGVSINVSIASLRVDITIPQALLETHPNDYIATENLTAGSTMGFFNYNASQFYSNYKNNEHFESTYLGLNGGMNIGMWRFRQQGNFTHDEYNNRWKSARIWLQRTLPSIRSEVSLGELFSSGNLFNSLSYRGGSLVSDVRMQPDSLRGYAPEVRGVANSNARVSIWQGKQQIYQTTVPAGPFVINNLSPVSFGGYLNVEVQESDGSRHHFSVPYAVLPDSLRPGRTDFSLSMGKVRDYSSFNNFYEMTVMHGLANALTMNGGLRLGEGYHSLLAGGVFASELGAIGFNAAFSSADLTSGESSQGWRYELNYSRTFEPTSSTLTFAGYQYSTQGYRDLSDVISLNNNYIPLANNTNSEYMQRNRLQVTLNQPIEGWGSFYVSASRQNYYGNRSRNTQFQMGYSTVLPRNISMNMTLSRQYTVFAYNNHFLPQFSRLINESEYRKNTQFQINFSVPLGTASESPYLTLGGNNDSGSGSRYNASLSGMMGEGRFGYSLNINRDQRQHDTTFSGSLNQKTALMNLAGTASKSSQFSQMSVNAMGAAVVHSGGVTFGNYLSDSFALIEAKGAKGARVMAGQGVEIDRNGYALVPSLSPYHYNTIALDSNGSDSQVEVQSSQKTIAPYAGAMVKVKFRTLRGYPVMMKISTNRKQSVPIGSDVIDMEGNILGSVGQGGNAYLRLNGTKGIINVVWGNGKAQSCKIDYRIPAPKNNAVITYANALCRS